MCVMFLSQLLSIIGWLDRNNTMLKLSLFLIMQINYISCIQPTLRLRLYDWILANNKGKKLIVAYFHSVFKIYPYKSFKLLWKS
jgi:hypothetical protein